MRQIPSFEVKLATFKKCYPMIPDNPDITSNPFWETFSHIWDLAVNATVCKYSYE